MMRTRSAKEGSGGKVGRDSVEPKCPWASSEKSGLDGVSPHRLDALLFGETQSRVVISCKLLDAVKVVERAKLMGVPAMQIGKVGGDKLTVKTASGEFSAPLTELHDLWWNSIARAMV